MTQGNYKEQILSYRERKQLTIDRIKKVGGKFIKFNDKKHKVHFLTSTMNKKVECIY